MKLIYLGCLSSSKYSDTCENAIKIIKSIDEEYEVLDNPPCCGALSFHIANEEELRDHVNYVNNWFKENGVRKIVTICAGCYNYLSRYYNEFIPDFDVEIKHLVQFLNEPQNLEKLNLNYKGKKLVIAYHDACHLKNAVNEILEEPRDIINAIEGDIILKDMENNRKLSVCCGAGGGVYSIFKENSDFNSRLIFEQARKQRAKLLLTACPFCYTALKRIKEEDKKIRISVMKIEDFINSIMEGLELS